MSQNKLLTRNEIPAEDKWHLTDIYPNIAEWQKSFDSLPALINEITALKGKLTEPAVLLDCFTKVDNLQLIVEKLFAFARMSADTDTANQEYQSLSAKCLPLIDKANTATAFIEPELLSLSDKELKEMADKLPGLNKYRFRFLELLRQKEHILDPAAEALIARTGEIRQSAQNTYTVMTNADLKFPDTLGEDGQMTTLSESRYMQFIRSESPAVRADAFKKLFNTYKAFRNTFASIYSASVSASKFIAQTRHFPSMIEAALSADNIPLAVYDTTIKVTNQYLPELHRYLKLKKKLLKLTELHMYDLYVPMVAKPKIKYTYEQGQALIREALKPLGSDYSNQLFAGLNGGWADRMENQGKRSGAYSWGVYGVHPFILMSWHDDYDAVSTLIHELGHSMHSYYSSKQQAYTNSQYTIFCAEVASTTNENLLLEYMLSHANSSDRLYYLNLYLEQIRTTVFRQVMFAEFEKITHASVEQGEVLTADKLESIWLELNQKYYGNDVIIDPEISAEWSRIPHFYRPFYVYQYATGYAAAMTISHKLRHEGEPARNAYLKYLGSGNSDYSINLLRNAGVDMTSAEPFTITFEKFKDCLDELEKSI